MRYYPGNIDSKRDPLNFITFGALFFLLNLGISCNIETGRTTLTLDSLETNIRSEELYNDYQAIRGFHAVYDEDGTLLLSTLKDSRSLFVFPVLQEGSLPQIPLQIDCRFIASNSNSVFCFTTDGDTCERISFSGKAEYQSTIFYLPRFLMTNEFISANIFSRIQVLNKEQFLIPFKCFNNSPNLLDTYAFYYLFRENDAYHFKKVIRYPHEYLVHYEFLSYPLVTFDSLTQTAFYTFQNQPKIYKLSLIKGAIDSADITGFTPSKFEEPRHHDLSYVRHYLRTSDAHMRLIWSGETGLILLSKNVTGNSPTYSIHVFDKDLDQTDDYRTEAQLNAEISFLFNKVLYVYKQGSVHTFYTLTITSGLHTTTDQE